MSPWSRMMYGMWESVSSQVPVLWVEYTEWSFHFRWPVVNFLHHISPKMAWMHWTLCLKAFHFWWLPLCWGVGYFLSFLQILFHAVGSVVKNLPAVQEAREMQVRSLDQEDLLEEGKATHSSILVWRIPMDRGAWKATVHGVIKNWTQLNSLTTTNMQFNMKFSMVSSTSPPTLQHTHLIGPLLFSRELVDSC